MTAQELIAALSARYLDTKQMLPDELAHKAAEMLIQQAEQIEALKADAERYRIFRQGLSLTVCVPTPTADKPNKSVTVIFGRNAEPNFGEALDAAIDAMKGKS